MIINAQCSPSQPGRLLHPRLTETLYASVQSTYRFVLCMYHAIVSYHYKQTCRSIYLGHTFRLKYAVPSTTYFQVFDLKFRVLKPEYVPVCTTRYILERLEKKHVPGTFLSKKVCTWYIPLSHTYQYVLVCTLAKCIPASGILAPWKILYILVYQV